MRVDHWNLVKRGTKVKLYSAAPRKMIGPILVRLRTKLGLDLPFGHPKLRTENVQIAIIWSTYEWILVSHNSLVSSCAKALAKSITMISVYVHDLQHHQGYLQNRVQTGQAVSHKIFDFGNHADSQQECSLRLDVCLCYLRLNVPGSCSICKRATRSVIFGVILFPCLYMGTTFACRQSSGTEPWASESL